MTSGPYCATVGIFGENKENENEFLSKMCRLFEFGALACRSKTLIDVLQNMKYSKQTFLYKKQRCTGLRLFFEQFEELSNKSVQISRSFSRNGLRRLNFLPTCIRRKSTPYFGRSFGFHDSQMVSENLLKFLLTFFYREQLSFVLCTWRPFDVHLSHLKQDLCYIADIRTFNDVSLHGMDTK